MMVLVGFAMCKGYLDKLETMEVVATPMVSPLGIATLCLALRGGKCPDLKHLVVPGGSLSLWPALGQALQSRMSQGGCCGLKSVKSKGGSAYLLSSLLPSGACEALEEMRLEGNPSLTDEAEEDLSFSQWLSRTRAPHLKALALPFINHNAVTPWCSPGIAPMLQVLQLCVNDAPSITSSPKSLDRVPGLSSKSFMSSSGEAPLNPSYHSWSRP